MTAPRAVIIGGSMAGLFAAIALKARGFAVSIYERAGGALANRGAGIATHDELYAALRTAGVELRDEMGVESRGRTMFDSDGSVIHTEQMPQVMTSWGLIYRFLRAQIADESYHLGHALKGIEANGEGVRAVFENGTEVGADWLIGADGARSTVRQCVEPATRAEYVGYFGWRGLFDENLIDPSIHAQVAHRITFGMAPGGHWLGYLVAGPNDELGPGQRWYNWGWYRSADEAMLREHLTDENGHCHAAGIPHHLIRAKLVEAMRDEAREYLAPQIQGIIESTPQPFLQGMYDFCCERLVHGRVVLIGDAASTARPHVGMGVSKAADDASTLASALSDGQTETLAAWEDARLRYARAVLQWGRDLGSYLGPQSDDPSLRAKAEHYRQPATLLAATAASNPMDYLKL